MNIILEVGVNTGQHTPGLRKRFNLPLHGFEPVPQLQEKLKNQFKDDPEIHLYPYAVDLVDGTAEFNIQRVEGTRGTYGCSSLYKFNKNIHKVWSRPRFHHDQVVEVKTIRIDTFLNDIAFDSIAYLHCDAQGNDFNVLLSFGEYIERLQSGVVEAALKVDLYDHTKNRVDKIVPWLEEHGFKVEVVPQGSGEEANVHFKR